WSVYEVDFIQDGLPVLGTRTHDLVAIALFFNSVRFSDNIYDGESAPPSIGLGNAFLEGDIIETFHSMAQSMTDQLRSNSSQPATTIGKAAHTIIRIHVRWLWIIYPAGV